jgi:histidyl-tRNA synthetase
MVGWFFISIGGNMKKMDKSTFQPLKGFRDFMPEKTIVRNKVIKILKNTFEKYGYEELVTPSLEKQEVLLGKYGKEAEKLMYLFKDKGDRSVGLRYDLTVPLARVMSNYPNITIPFKRYQIQPVWRGDKPQKGRYREIYQCDIDIVGSCSPIADAEIVLIVNDALRALGFSDFEIRINSRQVLYGVMKDNSIPKENWPTIIQTIDKLDKKDKSAISDELIEKGLSEKVTVNLFKSFENAQPDNFLKEVLSILTKLKIENVVFTPTLSRGLDYYTGPIFETVVKEPKIGSITGGGRYDNLLKDLGGPDLPATGTSFGLDRICDVIEENDLWDVKKTNTKVLVSVFSNELLEKSLITAKELRDKGINCEVYPDEDTQLKKQFKYANQKEIPWVIVLGPEEKEKEIITLKNMASGEQKQLALAEATKLIK